MEGQKSITQVCTTCLRAGRTLREITNENLKQIYFDILNEVHLYSMSVHVCWECEALIKKVSKFRECVQNSYRMLQRYSSQNLHMLVRDSSLSIHIPPSISITPQDKKDINVKDELKMEWSDEDVSLHIAQDCLADAEDTLKLDKNVDNLENSHTLDRNSSFSVHTPSISIKPQGKRNVKGELKIQWSDGDSSLHNDKDSLTDAEDLLQLDDNVNGETVVKKKSALFTKKCKVSSKLRRAEKIVKQLRIGLRKSKRRKKQDDKIITIDLSYEEMQLERSKEASKDSYVYAEFKCESCLIGFNYKKSYKAHVIAKHSSERGNYKCPVCKTVISSVESFTSHYKRHMRRYECSICQKRTMDIKVMQQHYNSTHDMSLKEYKCEICGKISNSIDTHRYHKDTHKARVQCPECDKTFTHRAGLLNHRLSVHEYNNAFPCTVCDKVFRWKTSLKRHVEKHNVKEVTPSAAYCSECGITFASVCSYQRHMKNSLKHVTHEQLRFICDHCGRRFADKTKLRDHIEEKHLFKTYQCHICMKPSKNRVGLDQHIRNVHKGRPHNKMCHYCGKSFPTKVQLESHIRVHTGERPFVCKYCPSTFSQQSNLYKHNRQVHLNIKTKRYATCKKKEDAIDERPPQLPHVEIYRPPNVPTIHYSPETGYVI